ncbi:MAG: hypothetical protein OEY34_00610, partial [Cyclobacteriaceae bacterium]|nr:hypothetical protein [Cyclobacteriaceae bacterium]
MRIVFLLFSHVLLYSFTPIFAQNEVDLLLNSFQSTDTLPSGILSEKTVVLIHTGDGSPQEFNRISEIVHANFLKAGIDAVSYYDILDLYAGKDVTRGFALYFRKREIENIIIVDYKGDDSRIFATVPDYKSDILVEGQSVWMRSGKVNEISSRLYISAANSGIERENFLINDIPEPGLLVNPI